MNAELIVDSVLKRAAVRSALTLWTAELLIFHNHIYGVNGKIASRNKVVTGNSKRYRHHLAYRKKKNELISSFPKTLL